VEEIKQHARDLLVREGAGGISLRAIARDMGMTPAALYRYFPSLEALMLAVCADLYTECTEYMIVARDAASADRVGDRLAAVSRAFRSWSVAHPAEFGLMFARPVPELTDHELDDPIAAECHRAGSRFGQTFAEIFAEMYQRAPFDVPQPEDLPPGLVEQLRQFVGLLVMPPGTNAERMQISIGSAVPIGAAQVYLSCWARIYGLVALEITGHLCFALTDVEPMFEAELAFTLRQLGVRD
jgi:AcrR family transcriptional regulator